MHVYYIYTCLGQKLKILTSAKNRKINMPIYLKGSSMAQILASAPSSEE